MDNDVVSPSSDRAPRSLVCSENTKEAAVRHTDADSGTTHRDPNEAGTVDLLVCLPDEARARLGLAARGDGGRFRILRSHAEGGLGRVSIALDSELGREVALKQIRDSFADDPVRRSKFIVEAVVTGRLEHPGIVPIYALDQDEAGRPYYAMRFIRGETLQDAVRRFHESIAETGGSFGSALELRLLLEKFLVVCQAIEFAHSRGVIHRDLKPANVMLGSFGETLVVDWGVAKLIDSVKDGHRGRIVEGDLMELATAALTLAGSRVGTPAYMSPEQARGELDELGARSDVYGLGAILYEIITGKAPVVGHDLATTLGIVARGEIIRPRTVSRRIPIALESICRKAMAFNADDRYPSATALADDVRRWLADEPVQAHPEWFFQKAWRGFLRNQLRMTILTFALFADAVILIGLGLAYAERIAKMNTDGVGVLTLLRVALVPLALQVGGALGLFAGRTLRWLARRRGFRHSPLVGTIGGACAAAAFMVLQLDSRSRFVTDLQAVSNRSSKQSSAAEPRLVESPPSDDDDGPCLPYSDPPAPLWLVAEAPFDVVEYERRTKAAQGHAGLYLDALMEFSPHVATVFSSAEGRRRARIAKAREELTRKWLDRWNTDRASVDRAELDRHLEEYAVGFLLLERAAHGTQDVSLRGLDREEMLGARVGGAVSRVLDLKVGRALEKGDTDAAVGDLVLLLRLSAALNRFNPLPDMRDPVFTYANLLRMTLSHSRLEVRHIDRLLREQTAYERDKAVWVVDCLRREFINRRLDLESRLESLLRDYRLGISAWRKVLGPRWADTGLQRDDFLANPEEYARLARERCLAYWRKVMAAESLYPHEIPGLRRSPLDHIETDPYSERLLHSKCLQELDVELAGAKCLLALRRKIELSSDGSFELQDIMNDAGVEHIPPDPFSADRQSMRLVFLETSPVIASVGKKSEAYRGNPILWRIEPRFCRIPPESLLGLSVAELARASRHVTRSEGRDATEYRFALVQIEEAIKRRQGRSFAPFFDSSFFYQDNSKPYSELVDLGVAQMRAGMVQEALANLNRALPEHGRSERPNVYFDIPVSSIAHWDAIARAYRARCHSRLGHTEAADADLDGVRRWLSGQEGSSLAPAIRTSVWAQLEQALADVSPVALPDDPFAEPEVRSGVR